MRGTYGVFAALALQSCSATHEMAVTLSDASGIFTVRDAVFVETADWKSGFATGTSTVLFITDYPNACDVVAQDASVASSQVVIVDLAAIDASGQSQPVDSIGAYSVQGDSPPPNAKAANIYYESRDAQCQSTKRFTKSGTVTLTTADKIAGTFEGTLATSLMDGPDLALHFVAATRCDGLGPALNRNSSQCIGP